MYAMVNTRMRSPPCRGIDEESTRLSLGIRRGERRSSTNPTKCELSYDALVRAAGSQSRCYACLEYYMGQYTKLRESKALNREFRYPIPLNEFGGRSQPVMCTSRRCAQAGAVSPSWVEEQRILGEIWRIQRLP